MIALFQETFPTANNSKEAGLKLTRKTFSGIMQRLELGTQSLSSNLLDRLLIIQTIRQKFLTPSIKCR
jgi:hypothetical protein